MEFYNISCFWFILLPYWFSNYYAKLSLMYPFGIDIIIANMFVTQGAFFTLFEVFILKASVLTKVLWLGVAFSLFFFCGVQTISAMVVVNIFTLLWEYKNFILISCFQKALLILITLIIMMITHIYQFEGTVNPGLFPYSFR